MNCIHGHAKGGRPGVRHHGARPERHTTPADELPIDKTTSDVTASPARADLSKETANAAEVPFALHGAAETHAPLWAGASAVSTPVPVAPARLRRKPTRLERPFTRLHLGLIGVCLAVAGCATTGDTAKPAHQSAPTSSPTTTAPPAPVSAASINEKLLTSSELTDIVGDTDMKPEQEPDLPTEAFDPPDCAALRLVGTAFSYFSAELAAMTPAWNGNARNQTAQLISVWPDPNQTKIVVHQSAYEWRYCPLDTPFTVTPDDGGAPTHWVPWSYTPDSASRIGMAAQRQELPQRTCYHVMARQANIVVEALACGEGNAAKQATQANKIADGILAKFPK